MDGGIRRGSDVFKAIGLGADAVLVGRPVLWALAVNGQGGVTQVLSLLNEGLALTMKLAGCARLNDITSDLLSGDRMFHTGCLHTRTKRGNYAAAAIPS
jgi:4-hydroxymandelate oxidase